MYQPAQKLGESSLLIDLSLELEQRLNRLRTGHIKPLEMLHEDQPPDPGELYAIRLASETLGLLVQGMNQLAQPLFSEQSAARSPSSANSLPPLSFESQDDLDEFVLIGSSDPLSLSSGPAALRKCVSRVEVVRHMSQVSWQVVLKAVELMISLESSEERLRALIKISTAFASTCGLLGLGVPCEKFVVSICSFALPMLFLRHEESVTVLLNATLPVLTSTDFIASSLPHPNEFMRFEHCRHASESRVIPCIFPYSRLTNVYLFLGLLLDVKNTLCLEALFNIVTLIGPVLGTTWHVILETLEQLDTLLQVFVVVLERK